MALWFGLMIILIVCSFCWSPDNGLGKKEKRYQRFKSMKEEQEEFERRYKMEKIKKKRQS